MALNTPLSHAETRHTVISLDMYSGNVVVVYNSQHENVSSTDRCKLDDIVLDVVTWGPGVGGGGASMHP